MKSHHGKHGYPVTVQLVCSGDTEEFRQTLAELQELGLFGVELNVPDLANTISAERLQVVLDSFGLKLTYIASGRYAVEHGLALCSADESVREASVRGLLANISYAAELNAGVIVGTFKGGPGHFAEGNRERLIQSMKEVMEQADPRVPVLLEATNHYEADTVNTLKDACAVVSEVDSPQLYILPDTYHMNIEEKDGYRALGKAMRRGLVRNIHISDNNRYFPGYGAIDFEELRRFLENSGYAGTLGIEGRTRKSVEEDLLKSVRYLKEIKLMR